MRFMRRHVDADATLHRQQMALERRTDAERNHRHRVLGAKRTTAATSSVLSQNTTTSGGVTG